MEGVDETEMMMFRVSETVVLYLNDETVDDEDENSGVVEDIVSLSMRKISRSMSCSYSI